MTSRGKIEKLVQFSPPCTWQKYIATYYQNLSRTNRLSEKLLTNEARTYEETKGQRDSNKLSVTGAQLQ